ncbi:hypothetical protein [Sinorhizobium meliloti]|uniref:hypothetical protein n=1 Tax=Rhizobium meliloti TaxID=382 RepID=UPI000FD7734D|nr:hypothetical protein [Sinorhizobium meliloti]RVL37989.1 hypothetical protein CN148_11755 [Sinorhizobium meliloti]
MAIGTPTHLIAAGATATTATSASFTPSANVRIFALCAARGSTAAVPTISDNLGGTWTAVTGSGIDAGVICGAIYYQDVGGGPSARTVTVTATGTPTQVGCEVFEISGTGAISSNFHSNVNAAGDPSVTMSAYAATSILVALGVGNAGSTWTQPTGCTEIYDLAPATNVRLNVSYDMTSPAMSLTWTSTSTDSIGYGLEITEATAGAAVAGSLAATEAGGDGFAGSGAVLLSGVLGAAEAGADVAAMAGSVPASGALATTEVGSDGFAGVGAVAVAGTFGASEAGADAFGASGVVSISGTLVAAETGSDTFVGSGSQVAAISGSVAATEAGSDAAAMSGAVSVAGVLGGSEVGADAVVGSGAVLVAGSLSTDEAGSETADMTGAVPVSGSMAADEAGADALSASDDQLGEPDPSRTVAVGVENRTASVDAESRVAVVAVENRTVAV